MSERPTEPPPESVREFEREIAELGEQRARDRHVYRLLEALFGGRDDSD